MSLNNRYFVLALGLAFAATAQQPQVYQAVPGNAQAYFPQNVQQTQNNQQFQSNQQFQNQLSVIPNDNIFLSYYAKQGDDFSASVFYNESGSLNKRDISADDLKKAIVIFSGDWCPFCHNFLSTFSQYIANLNSYGIKVIIVNVPSIDKLRNFEDPTMEDFEATKSKLESYGISFSNDTKLAMLGEKATLGRNGIEGLPVFIAVKDGHEYFRGVGQSGVSKLQLSNPVILKQFLEIWDEEVTSDTEKEEPKSEVKKKSNSKSSKAKSKTKNKKKSKKLVRTNEAKPSKVNVEVSRNATELLNSMNWTAQSMNIRQSYKHVHTRSCTCRVR